MPRDSEFAVLEMGMNHAGEIAALTRLVRPHVAMVTTIASAHIEHLGSIEAIADAKGEIFEGLEPDGVAIIPEDTPSATACSGPRAAMPSASSPSAAARPTSPRSTPCVRKAAAWSPRGWSTAN